MMIWVVLLFAAIILWTWLNSRSRRNLPPGPTPILPLIGNLLQLAKYKDLKMYETFDRLVEQYGPVVFIKAGRISQVVVQDLDLAKELLNSEAWTDRLFDSLIAVRSFGKPLGIIFNFGEGWKEMRKYSMKTLRDFGFGKQASMENILSEEISILTRTLDDHAVRGDDVCMRQFFSLSVLNILWSMMAETRFSHDDTRLKGLLNLVDEICKNNPIKADPLEVLPFFWRLQIFSSKIQQRRNVYKNMHIFLKETISERKQLGTYKDNPKDYFDAFLSEIDHHKNSGGANHYTNEQLIVVAYDMFAAGVETTANTLEFAILYMALNPTVQQKIQEEIDRVIGKSGTVTLKDKPRLPYIEATLLEVQRVANVLPVIIRGATEDTKLAGYDIPKGTIAGISILSLHQSKEIWGDPEEFRPERFLDAKNTIINANKILPFGLGKRVCIGESLARASLFSYFSSLMQRYTFKPSPKYKQPSTEPVYGFTLSPEKYFVVVEHR